MGIFILILIAVIFVSSLGFKLPPHQKIEDILPERMEFCTKALKALKDKDIKALGYERKSFIIGACVMYNNAENFADPTHTRNPNNYFFPNIDHSFLRYIDLSPEPDYDIQQIENQEADQEDEQVNEEENQSEEQDSDQVEEATEESEAEPEEKPEDKSEADANAETEEDSNTDVAVQSNVSV